jgi:hypothetical protein
MNKYLKKVIGVIIGIFYLSSLTLECYLIDGKPSIGSFGLIAFLLGWLNFDFIGLIWLANPLFLVSLFLFLFSKKAKLALILSLIAFVLSISFTQVGEIIKNEAGHIGQITDYLLGYWIWIIANLLLLIVLIINNILNYKKPMHNNA